MTSAHVCGFPVMSTEELRATVCAPRIQVTAHQDVAAMGPELGDNVPRARPAKHVTAVQE